MTANVRANGAIALLLAISAGVLLYFQFEKQSLSASTRKEGQRLNAMIAMRDELSQLATAPRPRTQIGESMRADLETMVRKQWPTAASTTSLDRGQRIRVTIDVVGLEPLLAWIERLRTSHALHLERVRLRPSARNPAQVTAELSFREAGS